METSVMEEVRGTPITNHADVHRLSTLERRRLVMDVCSAVQHAHLKGVVHRDLKPPNVLVPVTEAGPRVKLIGFGIAKAIGIGLTNDTLVTQVGQVIGTPEHMNPEQADTAGLLAHAGSPPLLPFGAGPAAADAPLPAHPGAGASCVGTPSRWKLPSLRRVPSSLRSAAVIPRRSRMR